MPSHFGFRVRIRFAFLFLFMLLGMTLYGCSSIPPEVRAAKIEKLNRVGVISLLPSTLTYSKIGVTVFNNEVEQRPVGTRFNDAARKGAEAALKASGRDVVQIQVDTQAFAKKYRSAAIVFDSPAEQVKDELLILIKEHKLDGVLIIAEEFDAERGIHGIYVRLRAGISEITSVAARPDFHSMLVGSDTKYISSRFVMERLPVNRAAGMWSYNLKDNLDEATNARVTDMLVQHIEKTAAAHVARLGF